jgi:hypothetical protein
LEEKMDQIEYVLYIGEPDVVSFESHLELKSNVTFPDIQKGQVLRLSDIAKVIVTEVQHNIFKGKITTFQTLVWTTLKGFENDKL